MIPGLSHDIVVRFVPSCYPGSASSTQFLGFDEVWMHPYNYSLHCKLFKHFIYIYYGSVIQSEMVPGLNHAILVWFVCSCHPGSDSLTHLHGFDEVRMHPYGHPLHLKVLKYYIIYII